MNENDITFAYGPDRLQGSSQIDILPPPPPLVHHAIPTIRPTEAKAAQHP